MRPAVSSVASWIRFEPSPLSFSLCLSLGLRGEEGKTEVAMWESFISLSQPWLFLVISQSYRFLSLGIKRALSDLPSLPCSLRFLSPFLSFSLAFPSISSSPFSFHIPVSYIPSLSFGLVLSSFSSLPCVPFHLSNIFTFLLVRFLAFTFCQLSDALFFFSFHLPVSSSPFLLSSFILLDFFLTFPYPLFPLIFFLSTIRAHQLHTFTCKQLCMILVMV